MQSRNETTYGLTQKGWTATCSVCNGMGCVLASPVTESRNVDALASSESLAVDAAKVLPVEVLIPCPGCFVPTTGEQL